MINLEQSLPKEMLRTNKSGAYHCTSIVGCNTRKQHGLLVIPIPEMDDTAHVLLSSLDETVIQHGAAFNLGIHQYGENVFAPNGHKYIREFNCDTVPEVTYRVGGVILTKEKVFLSHLNRILIRYTLVEAHSPTTLQFRPMLAYRNANDLCVENDALNKDCRDVAGGIATCMYNGYPELFMQFDKPVKWVPDGHWYKGVEYYKDKNRGLPYKEDLWVPGYFTLDIRKGESVIFSASTYESDPALFREEYESELLSRTSRTSFYNCLKNSATQFYFRNKSGMYLMAGYPWLNVRARDAMIGLPGCTLSIDKADVFRDVMKTFLKALRNWIEKGERDKVIKEIDLPDIPLWTLWAIKQYERAEGEDACFSEYGEASRFLVEAIMGGKVPDLRLGADGLLVTRGEERPVTWMSASVNGRPLIPRTGKVVEFNALWYNALRSVADLFRRDPEAKAFVNKLDGIAENTGESFVATFLNEHGYLYDYVSFNHKDPEVRPNMAIAIGMEHSPLNRRQKRKVLEFVTRELLTPKGLRSLSPKSSVYNPVYKGNPVERQLAVHQGPARPWLFGFYAEAYLNVMGRSGLSFIERMLIGFEEEMAEGCIGSLSELYDGNPPYTGRGAVSTSKNVGQILHIIKLVKELNKKFNEEDGI